MSIGSNEYMVGAGGADRADSVSRDRFEDTGVYCRFVHYRKYFVVHCGLVQVIEVSGGNIDGVQSLRGEPVFLYNVSDCRHNYGVYVILRYYFPDYAAEGQPWRQTGWMIVPYALADKLARWIAQRAPAVQVEWRLPDLIDLT